MILLIVVLIMPLSSAAVGLVQLLEASGLEWASGSHQPVSAGMVHLCGHNSAIYLQNTADSFMDLHIVTGPTPNIGSTVTVNMSASIPVLAAIMLHNQTGTAALVTVHSTEITLVTMDGQCGSATVAARLALPSGNWSFVDVAACSNNLCHGVVGEWTNGSPAFFSFEIDLDQRTVAAKGGFQLPIASCRALAFQSFDGVHALAVVSQDLSNHSRSTVSVFSIESHGTSQRQLIANTTREFAVHAWVNAHFASLLGDGVPQVVVVGDAVKPGSNLMLLTYNGSKELRLDASESLASQDRPWCGSMAGSFLTQRQLPGEDQLLVRRCGDTASVFKVDTLLYGRSVHFLVRREAVAQTRAQYNDRQDVTFNGTTLVEGLKLTSANTYSGVVCAGNSTAPGSYTSFISLLQATEDAAVHRRQVRVWLTLLPPTEALPDKCPIPPDDPRTPFNETSLFNSSLGYIDYQAWSELVGRLALQFPHLVALQIDDLSHNVRQPGGIFTPPLVARMTSALRAATPWVNLISTVYYNEGGPGPENFIWKLWPDLPLVIDTPLFYFRNQKQGAGPCADPKCPWGPAMKTREGGCLAGACADSTVQNAEGEIRDIVAGLPEGRRLQVGFYATGHSSLGTPTPLYVFRLMGVILSQAMVDGITFYTYKVPQSPNCSQHILSDEGCIVSNVFSSICQSNLD